MCERGDSNPHTFWVLDPKSSASANSATLAKRLAKLVIPKLISNFPSIED